MRRGLLTAAMAAMIMLSVPATAVAGGPHRHGGRMRYHGWHTTAMVPAFRTVQVDRTTTVYKTSRPERKQQPESQSEEEMKQRFERSQKILDLLKKYYGIYSAFLTQKQISRVYEIEREMIHRLSHQKPQGQKSQ